LFLSARPPAACRFSHSKGDYGSCQGGQHCDRDEKRILATTYVRSRGTDHRQNETACGQWSEDRKDASQRREDDADGSENLDDANRPQGPRLKAIYSGKARPLSEQLVFRLQEFHTPGR
jgi:hypothetical protein